MKDLRTLAVLFFLTLGVLLAAGLSGCGALDELDAANAMMETEKSKKADAAAKAGEPEEEGRPLKWDNVNSLHAGELDESIVRCQLGGSTQFMRADNCRARGGRVGGV